MSDAQPRGLVEVECEVNGASVSRTVRPNRTLVEFLRSELSLTGTTEGCGVGVCGCCTVQVDGDPINACLELAVNVDGKSVVTVEGLNDRSGYHPVQEAFKAEEGFQCGYCTPGMIMMAKSLFEEYPDPDEDVIEKYMSENLCRCTGYESITASLRTARERVSER